MVTCLESMARYLLKHSKLPLMLFVILIHASGAADKLHVCASTTARSICEYVSPDFQRQLLKR